MALACTEITGAGKPISALGPRRSAGWSSSTAGTASEADLSRWIQRHLEVAVHPFLRAGPHSQTLRQRCFAALDPARNWRDVRRLHFGWSCGTPSVALPRARTVRSTAPPAEA